ncbi:MAG: pyocin knob domain-containing protein, partial [Eggerthella lenta]|nr:pyocin knob domain-containing protein [Eggerthella lenta]
MERLERLKVTYTDEDGVEIGMLGSYSLDLAYGSDENDFALTADIGFHLPKKSLVYIDGTEWGGVVRGCRPSTLGESPTNTITGQTWHGVLAESCICPDAGADYYESSGEANAALRALVARQGLGDLFDVSPEDSGFRVSYRHERFADSYSSIRKMLRRSGAKLRISKEPGRKPELSAVEVGSHVDDGSSQRYGYELRVGTPYNHIICLGMGDLAERAVVHLYADADGNVSSVQTLFGLDERQYVYELSNREADELAEEGAKKLKELQATSMCELRLPEDESFDVGDVVGVIDDETGVSVVSDVTKVVVRIGGSGAPEVSNEIGDITVRRTEEGYYQGASAGIVYKAGDGIRIDGATISADVTNEKLAEVEAKAESAGKVAAAAVKSVRGASPVVAAESGGIVTVSHAASGVSGGSYGPAADSSPSWGEAATVGSRLVIDGSGHVKEAAGRRLVMPSSVATPSAKGLMSADDKKKIDAYPWDAISGKPATFAPSAHGHPWADVTGKPTAFPPSAHGHSAADVTVGTLPLARGGTGGSSAQAACDSLMAASMGAKRVVPANADLNAYKTPGSYTCNADANAKTLANCPTGGVSFHMIVDQVLGHGTYLSQTIRQYNANIVWMRVSTNAGASWGAWQRTWAIAPDAAAARASIGAAASSHGHGAMTGASASAAGAAGFVPAPAAGAATRYLRSDGTWQVPPDTNTVYTHPATPGNKHVPAGGSSGQILRWGADGTAVWGADNNTTYSAMAGATASAAGRAGLVPAPAAGKQASFLRGDGAWAVPAAGVPAAHTHSAADIASGALAIARGGTGSTSRKGAFDGLSFLGDNPVKTVAGDTVGAWTSLGSGYAWYSVAGQLSGQPSQYGFLVSYVRGGDVWQLWHPQSSGDLYVRSGNGSGWSHGWRKSALEAYPVGALYLSFSATSPASLFGGTWAQISGRFLRAASGTGTGGSDTCTLTGTQMPGHYHGVVREQDGDWAGYWQSNASGGGLWWIVSNGTPGANRGLKTTSVGGGGSHNNMPAYQDV